MSIIEMTTFTVAPENTRAMLDARPGMVAAFRADRRGFLSARLVRVDERTWHDLVEWTDEAAWDESKAKGANLPAIAAFLDTIDEFVEADGDPHPDDGRDRIRAMAYGPDPCHIGELRLPEGKGPVPVVVVVHGGHQPATGDRQRITAVVDDLVARGYAVWGIECRRVGAPGTVLDLAAAVDALDDMDPALDTDRVVLLGYAAAGHLATWAARRGSLPPGAPGAAPLITPVGVVTLGPDEGTDLVPPGGRTSPVEPADTGVPVLAVQNTRIDPAHPVWPIVTAWIREVTAGRG